MSTELDDVRDTLRGIGAVSALLAGEEPTRVDRTAVALLIAAQAECAALKLERAERDISALRGMAWYNGLTERERAEWHAKASSAAAADCYAAYRRERGGL